MMVAKMRFALALGGLLVVGAAKAEAPPCSEPGVIDNLRDNVRSKIRSAIRPLGIALLDKITAIQVPDGQFDVRVTEMFTVSHSEDVRECQASLHLVEPGRTDGTTAIHYQVVRTEDGKNIYSIGGERSLTTQLFDSVDTNNNLTPRIQEVGREILRSANEQSSMKRYMEANPDFNKPAATYPPSRF